MMDTSCPSCKHDYTIDDNQFAQTVNCPKCQHSHLAMFAVSETPKPDICLELAEESEATTPSTAAPSTVTTQKPLSASQSKMSKHIDMIETEMARFIPLLLEAEAKRENESNTRMIIDKILMEVLGYKIEEIKTEQKIQGKRADYVLSVNDRDLIVIELKRVGMPLRDKQAFQAVSYGAYSGIRWALLTNGLVWHLYRVQLCEKVDYSLVFTLDLRDGLDKTESHYFYLLSRHGMLRKGLLDKVWHKLNALSYENLVNTVLTDEVITKIRTTLNKESTVRLSQDEVRSAVENTLLQLN